MTNRWVQLGSSLIAMIMIANLQYSWTLFVQPLQQANGWRLSDIQWAFTLFVVCQTWVMPMEGWLIDRLGSRSFVTVAGVLCGVGWGAMGTATTLFELYGYYALAAVGAAFVYSGSMAAALKWFPDRRGLAVGIIAGGFGSGSALFIPLISYLIRTLDYHRAFFYTGAVQGLVILMVAQVLRKPRPGETGEVGQTVTARTVPAVRSNSQQFTTMEMLRTPQFYILYVMFLLMATGGLLVTAQAGPVAREWKITLGALTLALALNSVANGVSRITWGWISDRMGREPTMAVAFLLQAACLVSVLALGRRSDTLFVVTLVLVFLTWGEVFSLFASTVGDYYGSANATSNYCFMYTAKGVASVIGGGFGAMLFERSGSWSAALYGSAALALLSGLLALILRAAPLPSKRAVEVSPLVVMR